MLTKLKNTSHWLNVVSLVVLYTLIYGPSVFARIFDSEFMEIDPRSIMSSLDGLTSGPSYYNMNDQYHSKYYGWTYFSLNYILIMVAKLFGFASEVNINLIVRSTLFLIGAGVIVQTYYLAKLFFHRILAFALTVVIMVSPVTAHYFITIHPESLGLLLQLICVGILISIYRSLPEFSVLKFLLAVAALSLSALSKQAFFISGVFIYTGFFIISILGSKKTSGFEAWQQVFKLTLMASILSLVILFIIHPYALLEVDRFLQNQADLSNGHSAATFADTWPRWQEQILANHVVLLNILFLPFILLMRQSPMALKISSAFSLITMAIFIFNARLIVNIGYIYPVYFFLFFNICYFAFKVVPPIVKQAAGKKTGGVLMFVLAMGVFLVSFSNFALTLTNTHKRFWLDGLTTQYMTWEYLKDFEAGTKVVFSPNVAILQPLIPTSCSAWGGCGKQADIAQYDPDIIVFSPEYPHYDWAEDYKNFISQNEFELLASVKINKQPEELSLCNSNRANLKNGIVPFISHYLLLQTPMRCLITYNFSVQSYTTKTPVSGHETFIYLKRQ